MSQNQTDIIIISRQQLLHLVKHAYVVGCNDGNLYGLPATKAIVTKEAQVIIDEFLEYLATPEP
jgi:hypothetical protein